MKSENNIVPHPPFYDLKETLNILKAYNSFEQGWSEKLLFESALFFLEQFAKTYENGGNCHCIISLSQEEFQKFIEFQKI